MADPRVRAGDVTVVVPTVGRPSLRALLDALAGGSVVPDRVVLVDDRPAPAAALLDGPALLDVAALPTGAALPPPWACVLTGRAAGPAAARNVGWRAATTPWVAFLDDDVLPPPEWFGLLLADLSGCAADVGASQGRIAVPLPTDRRPTDWERNVSGLQDARWATADMAYRRRVLADLGGFDERFPRAYREDADLGLRTVESGWLVVRGDRHVQHPVRPADRWVSLRLQRGNADDVLMRVLHGPDWRSRAGVPRGRRRVHQTTTLALAVGSAGLLTRRPTVATAGFSAYSLLVGELGWRRIAPGPRTRAEITTMAVTSTVLPLLATYHWLAGWAGVRRRLAAGGPVPEALPAAEAVPGEAVPGEAVPDVELPA